MNRLFSVKYVAATAIVLGAFGAATAAHARSDVVFSIGVQAPFYAQPEPVYVQPQPVYVAPQPVYAQPQYGVTYVYDRDYRYRHHHRYARGPWGDYDHDGVPNRYDRFPGNPYRR